MPTQPAALLEYTQAEFDIQATLLDSYADWWGHHGYDVVQSELAFAADSLRRAAAALRAAAVTRTGDGRAT